MYAARRRQNQSIGNSISANCSSGQELQFINHIFRQFPQGGFVGHQVALHQSQSCTSPQSGASVVEHHQHQSSSWLKFMVSPRFPADGGIALRGIALFLEIHQHRRALVFNLSRPQDFEGHSLSVGDVIALKRNGEVSVHYVDSIGFSAHPATWRADQHSR